MASFCRLILFDKRGTGLSDRDTGIPDLQTRMDDIRAVMDAVGSRRAAIVGVSEGGPMTILFAATYPERTAGRRPVRHVGVVCEGRRLPLGTDSRGVGRGDPEGRSPHRDLRMDRRAPGALRPEHARRRGGKAVVAGVGPDQRKPVCGGRAAAHEQ